jgi:hypothetical protein
MANAEIRRETGASLMFIGLAVWVVDLLVLFFLPAAMKLGRQGSFTSILTVLFALGFCLIVFGYTARGKADE